MYRIVLSGIFYPLAMLRYFEAALRRRDDIELFTVGPYTDNWIPWNGGMELSTKASPPDLILSRGKTFPKVVPIQFVETHLPWKPDLWLQIDASFFFTDKPQNGLNFIVGTDPHVLNYDQQRLSADKFFCMQKVYAQGDDEYLPYAFDPIWHSPMEEVESTFDICFIGLHYPMRSRLIRELKIKGVSVYHNNGPVYDEARLLYNQAPIGFNWSSKQDLTARVFELLGMKRLAVVNSVPDLDEFFVDGQDLVVFTNLIDAVNKIIYYLNNLQKTQEISISGHSAVQPHTWDARIEQILSYLRD